MEKGITIRKHEFFDEVIYTDGVEEMDTGAYQPKLDYPPFLTETYVVPKGTVKAEGYRPTACDMLVMRDQPVKMRDGATIYVDIFRPVAGGGGGEGPAEGEGSDGPAAGGSAGDATGAEKPPVLLAWTPYGKVDPPNNYDLYANRAWMDKDQSCGFDTFEGPEPDYWVNFGYAVAVADSRGSTHSEGAMPYLGHQEGLDIHDCVEWLGTQEWSNGKVAMVGNSWLGICQYFAADTKPPHLAAIAPWEGYSDIYRDVVCRGGIPGAEFLNAVNKTLRIPNGIESIPMMLDAHPFFDDYWANEKRAKFADIAIPAYFAASYSSCVHPYGTLRAYSLIPSKDKWLRIHNTQEWPDQQTPKYRDDLRDFFDHFLKGEDNGWPERTARARVSLLDAFGPDIVDREEEGFPIPHTDYRRLYLDGAGLGLSYGKPAEGSKASYEVGRDKDGSVRFKVRFDEDVDICGYCSARLFVSTDRGSDMDLFMYVYKTDSLDVERFPQMLGVDFMGAEARLRVSHRKVACRDLFDWQHEHKAEEPIEPGQVVEIETVFWPTGTTVRKGEHLVLVVSAKELQLFEFPTPRLKTRNEGTHTIHTGGEHGSYITIPVI